LSNALVPLAPVDEPAGEKAADEKAEEARAGGRPNADFVAHLIATSEQVPQTRTRRRAEPEEAIAAYRALGQWPSPVGRALSRSL